jgi:carbonic anhydrase/acetyltransferase-like protein (isoleucine patch superfamily)
MERELIAKLIKVLKSPSLFCALVNAQWRMAGRGRVPVTTRLTGRVRMRGKGLALGQGVCICGDVTPVEFTTVDTGQICIGDHSFINYGSSFTAYSNVTVGQHCHLGHYLFIADNNEHDLDGHSRRPVSQPVFIEDHVWIGTRVVVLPGVHIGRHSVVGAGSVVTRNIPPYSVAGGNPARVIRNLKPKAPKLPASGG